MYTRNYYTEEPSRLPENYSGVTFKEEPPVTEANTVAADAPPKDEIDKIIEKEEANEASAPARGWLSKLSGAPLFSSIFSKEGGLFGSLGLSKIGTEEILIIGVALFLLFSKEGDKECAIILLLLLLVN